MIFKRTFAFVYLFVKRYLNLFVNASFVWVFDLCQLFIHMFLFAKGQTKSVLINT